MMTRQIFIFSIAFLLSLVLVDAARACSCATSPTIDIVVERTPNIAIFKVQTVEKYAQGEKGYNNIKQARLIVEKVYKGDLKVGEEYIFGQGGGNLCLWTFSEESTSKSSLFYLSEKPKPGKNWWASFCPRSGASDLIFADLLYLEKLTEVKGKTRLAGTVWKKVRTAGEGDTYTLDPLADHKINISGNGKNVELKTDRNGTFEIYDLPAGKYKITPEKIAGYKFNDENKDSVEVEIKAESHAEIGFRYTINTVKGNSIEDIKTPQIQTKTVNDMYEY